MKKKVLFLCIVALTMLAATGQVFAAFNQVSMNFGENPGNQVFAGGQYIGPFSTNSSYWNSSMTPTTGDKTAGTVVDMVDATGASTGITVEWACSTTWYNGDGVGDDQHKLAVGYLDDGDPNATGKGASVTFTNIPYANYKIVGLYTSGQGDTAMVNFDVNGTWVLGGDATTTADVYGSINSCNTNTGSYWTQIEPGVTRGNYWVVDATGSTCTITGELRSGSNRGSLAGVIILTDEVIPSPQRSISHNFQSYESAGGWGFHWYLSRSSNATAGYYEPNGLFPVQCPSGTWNEGIYKDQTYLAKDHTGTTDTAIAVHTGDFEWHTSWYRNVTNFFAGTAADDPSDPWGLEDVKNRYRVAVGFIGHNGNAQPAKPLTALQKVPYGKYTVVTYMHPNRTGDQQQITIGDQTYYYIDQNGSTEFQEGLKADPNDGGWLFATETTSPATKQANIAVFSGLTAPDMTILFQTPANSGISGYSLISEVDSDNVATQVAPGNVDKDYGGTPVSIDTVLSWSAPGNGADSYDVYIKEYDVTDPNLSNPSYMLDALAEAGNTTGSYDPVLEYGKTYVWRVDTVRGGETYTGDYFYFDVEGDPVIMVQPRSVSVEEGTDTFFDVDAVLAENYAWYYSPDAANDTPGDDVLLQDGPSAQVDILEVAPADTGYYYVVLTNTIAGSNAITSEIASLEIGQLEVYIPFDGDPNDYSGNDWLILPGNRIVDVNGVYVGPANGEISYQTGWDGAGQAAKFTRGSGDQIEVVGSDDYFNFYPKGFTVRFWVKPTYGVGGYVTYMGKSSNAWNPPAQGWRMFDECEYASTGLVANMSPLSRNQGGRLDDGNWHLVACTYDGATQELKVYQNGFLTGTIAGSLGAPTSYPLVIGNQYSTGTGGWGYEGLIDEVEIFSYAISEYDMLEDYAIKTGQDFCLAAIPGDVNGDCKVDLLDISDTSAQWLNSTNPGSAPFTRVVSWKFDETTGLVATDSSGNGLNGALGAGFADDADAQWVVDGGRTGTTGDHALYFNGDPNTAVTATVASPAALPNGAGNIFEGTASWTINLWIKYASEAAASAMTNIGGFGQNEWLDPSVNSDRYFASYNGGYEFELGQAGIWPSNPLGTDWQMMTATYDGTTCTVYLNGVQVAQQTVALVNTLANEINLNTARRVLWAGVDATVPLNGTIDDFSIWSEAFNAVQVLGMYENAFPSCDGALAADLNGDCEVDVNDLLIVADDWLECQRVPSSLCD